MEAPPVQYVRSSDGYDIAYFVCGQGRPFVFLHTTWGNLHVAWRRYPRWMQGLARRLKLVSYDPRGWGFSTRGLPPDLTLDDITRDLAAVIDGLGLQRVVLYAFGARGHDAVHYASAHPEHVEALIWCAAHVSAEAFPQAQFVQLAKENWELFLSTLAPRGLPIDEYDEWINDNRESVTFEDFENSVLLRRTSIEHEIRTLKVPTLILYPRGFPSLSEDESRKVAALVPGARFVLIDGDRHNVRGSLHGDPEEGLAAIDAFLRDLPATVPSGADGPSLSAREVEVLRLLAAGKSNQRIAEALVISPSTVAKHVSSILTKTGAANRAEAAAFAGRHGLA
jgi:pimeloyl-ACP methyl ester carboxylesterase/DNA-binding CsgD family transcriptional regulator